MYKEGKKRRAQLKSADRGKKIIPEGKKIKGKLSHLKTREGRGEKKGEKRESKNQERKIQGGLP